jgi:hypothetical protein
MLSGTYVFSIGKVYVGEWKRSNMEGKGVETWIDGRRYEGEFKNGKKEGEGTFIW